MFRLTKLTFLLAFTIAGYNVASIRWFNARGGERLPSRGAEDIRGRVIGEPSVNLIEQEFGHPVVLQLLRVTPGGSVTGGDLVPASGALTDVGDREGFRVDILPEPALRPDECSVDVVPPSGSAIEAADPPMAIQCGDAHYQGATVVPTTLQVWIQPQR